MKLLRRLARACLLPALAAPVLAVCPTFSPAQNGGETCDAALAVAGEFSIPFNNAASSTSGFLGSGGCSTFPIANDQFYAWTADASGDYRFHVLGDYGPFFIAQLRVFSEDGCSGVCLGQGQGDGSLGEFYDAVDVAAGDTFLLQIGGLNAVGQGQASELEVTRIIGNRCATPIDIQGQGVETGSLSGITASGFTGAAPCAGMPAFRQDKFYRWTASVPGRYRFSGRVNQAGGNRPSYVAVYAGGDCSATCIAFDASAAQFNANASVVVAGVQAGDQLLVRLAGSCVCPLTPGSTRLEYVREGCGTADSLEPNSTFADAVLLTPGTYGGLNVAGGQDEDYFKAVLDPGQVLYVDRAVASGPSLVVRRYDELTGLAMQSPLSFEAGAPIFINRFPTTETFYFGLSSEGGSGTCSEYSLRVTVGEDPCGFDPLAPQELEYLPPGVHAGRVFRRYAPREYDFVVPGGETLDVRFDPEVPSTLVFNCRIRQDGALVGTGSRSGFQWSNSSPLPVTVRMGTFLNVPGPQVEFQNPCVGVDITVSYGGQLGTPYCTPGVLNTSGAAGEIRAIGSPEPSTNRLTLIGSQLPPNEFALLLASQTQGQVFWPGGSRGVLCLGGSIARFNSQVTSISPLGVCQIDVDTSNVPEPPLFGTAVTAGQRWNFQLWHRDTAFGPATNFTDAVTIQY